MSSYICGWLRKGMSKKLYVLNYNFETPSISPSLYKIGYRKVLHTIIIQNHKAVRLINENGRNHSIKTTFSIEFRIDRLVTKVT